MGWKELGSVAPHLLVDARLQLHHAAQVVASAGATFLEAKQDDSHPNFGWVESVGALLGHPLPGESTQVRLRIADLTLILVDGQGRVRSSFGLEKKKLDDAYAWLASATTEAGAKLPRSGITRVSYEIPNHAGAERAPFVFTGDAFGELARWFSNGHDALEAFATRKQGFTDVRCWPHHFDLGALRTTATDSDGQATQSIGIGLSPGDEHYAEPYAYLSPWPAPNPEALEPLEAGGHWHSEGFTSAILTASELLAGSSEGQADRLGRFLDAAMNASLRVLQN